MSTKTSATESVTPGSRFRKKVEEASIVPLIGVYDVFSATVSARYYDGLFVSGFGFAASHYGLPDIGFIAWTDIVDFVRRIRAVLPRHHIVVDIDDGYADTELACHVTRTLERAGASGIIIEDQQRPRRCGHADGKQVMAKGEFVEKLGRVLEARTDLFVVARTDSINIDDALDRASSYARAGADAVLIDGICSLELLSQAASRIGRPLMFNQLAGGKSPDCSLAQLRECGVKLVNYSTPCLFAAQSAIARTMESLQLNSGQLGALNIAHSSLTECATILEQNLARSRAGVSSDMGSEEQVSWQ